MLFPDDGVTKGELIEYYGHVADWMLPYLRDHPIAMARFPDGIARFTLRTIGERLAGTPDPWASLSRHRYDVAAASPPSPLSGRVSG